VTDLELRLLLNFLVLNRVDMFLIPMIATMQVLVLDEAARERDIQLQLLVVARLVLVKFSLVPTELGREEVIH